MKKYIRLLIFAVLVISFIGISICSKTFALAQQLDDVDRSAQTNDVGGSQADTEGWQLYVRNQRLNTDYIISDRKFYLPVVDFLRALRFGYTQGDDGTVNISSSPGDYGPIASPSGQLKCVFGDNSFSVPVRMGRSGIYVNARKMATNLGVSFIVNRATKIVDVVVPQRMSAKEFELKKKQAEIQVNRQASETGETTIDTKAGLDQGPTAGPAGQVAQSQPTENDKKEESPIKQVGEIGGFADDRLGQCYWTVTVKNEGDQAVNNVVLILHVQDGNGQDYDTQIKPIGNMNPGDTQKVEFYYQGMRLRIVTPKIEIKHDPLPKKEPPKASAPGTTPPAPTTEKKPAGK